MRLSRVEEILDEVRAGRMVILADDENRENEGDLICPAQFASPDIINFMITHGRGLVCLALEKRRVEALGLPMMAAKNGARFNTAFTVSIEAKDGITTGISAFERAHTIKVAIDETKGADELVSPGHVFPLVAAEGGVLARAGHTEAGVEIARMAGLVPAAVLCEIIRDDGHMARLPDLMAFGARHGLKVGTVADLVAYVRERE